MLSAALVPGEDAYIAWFESNKAKGHSGQPKCQQALGGQTEY